MTCRFVCTVAFCLLSATGWSSSRGQDWRVERVLGSERLELRAIDTVVAPPERGGRLQAALEDFLALWEERIANAGTARRIFEDETRGAEGSRELSIVEAGVSPRPKNAIFLELHPVAHPRFTARLSIGGFTIERRRTRVYVRAADEAGLVNGIYALSGDLLGARWYWAGAMGFEWVGAVPEKFPERYWREEPAFVQRSLYPVDGAYGRRNRLNGRYSFNHNLARVFGAELLDTAPEVFAEVEGQRARPRGSAQYDPQPDFTESATVRIAAEAARDHFEKNPKSPSFSLSINDNVLFDDSPTTEAVVTGRTEDGVKYFRGRPDYTPLVFGFMNDVAERVFGPVTGNQAGRTGGLERRGRFRGGSQAASAAASFFRSQPDKFLTALAYYWTEPAPDFRLHPRIMPVLTSDRAQWHDPAYRAEDKALIAEWVRSGAERIATWDYYFGAPYPYPRQFNAWMAESIRYLHAQGVEVFFSQLPSMWGHDGAKAWLAAELLWDPEQDAEALLEKYYDAFFGPAAGPMRAFYEIAEAHRNAHAGEAEWIKFYKDEAGIELFAGAVLRDLRARVEAAEASVAGEAPRFGERVAVVSQALELSERYAAYHLARLAMMEQALGWDRPVLFGVSPTEFPAKVEREASVGAVLGAIRTYLEAREGFERRARELMERPYHSAFRHFMRVKQTDPLPIVLAALPEGALEEVGKLLPAAYESALTAIRQARRDAEKVRGNLRNGDLGHAEGPWKTFNFLGPPVPRIPWWYFDFRPAEEFRVEAAESGSGVRLRGADMVSFFSDVPVVGERDYWLEVDLAWRVSPDNRSQLRLTWKDRDEGVLRVDLPLQLPNGESDGVQTIRMPIRAPARAYDLRIHFTASRQDEGDYLEVREVRWGLIIGG